MVRPPFVGALALALVVLFAAPSILVADTLPAGPGLGPVVSTADGGQIFGWDINGHGNDGLLTSSQDISGGRFLTSVETFNQTTGKIVKTVLVHRDQSDFITDGIFANDVGLVNHEENNAVRVYGVMKPVMGNKFNGMWTPPVTHLEVLQNAVNQDTSTSVVFAIELFNQDIPDLVVSNIATNSGFKIFHLDPGHFGLQDGPQVAQDTLHNEAVVATSPDGGAVGGQVPLIQTVNLTNGKTKQFNGVVTGPFHSGFVNGLAVDSKTRIACTTTELDAAVEFYNLANGSGHFVILPGAHNGDQAFSGAAVANDPIHHLFLVAQPTSSVAQNGSTIDVFKEDGTFVESINGFNFSNRFSVIFVRVAVNPAKRTGYVDGPNINQLQEFRY
jgi:hypothetical protein